MGRVKDLLLDVEVLNELGVIITVNDIMEMSEAENLPVTEIIEDLKNEL